MNHYCPEYRDDCEGCQPALMDEEGNKLAPDSPVMIAVMAFWKTVPLDHKRACHRVWCFNSRDVGDLTILKKVSEGMNTALQHAGN